MTSPAQRSLTELLRDAGLADRVPADTSAWAGVRVRGVAFSSARVTPGDVFVALRGLRDGADFAADAVARGAVAVVAASPDRGVGVPWVVVADARAALADLAAVAWGRPSERLAVIGITGTNGKTTTSEMVAAILGADGRPAGVVGTCGAHWPGGQAAAGRTTPEAPDLQELLATMADAGCRAAALEVSSHGVDQSRVRATRFAALAFTNLSQDHLDWHGTLESYYQSKRRLFSEVAPGAPVACAIDDAHGRRLATELAAADPRRPVVTCGFASDAAVRVDDYRVEAGGARFRLCGLGLAADVRLPLPGRHNAVNAALAAAACALIGVRPEAIAAGLAALPTVPGRLERVDDGQPGQPAAYVDYAHTPAALEAALSAAREVTAGRLICVFGCGGDRDREKRAPMGRAVGAGADVAVLTSDNPRSEDPLAIVRQVEAGLVGARAEVHVEPDRRRAIALALSLAGPRDTVLVAGKGHETVQEIGAQRLPFDDRQVTRELLARRGTAGGPDGSRRP